jgi:hypothetical protein
LAVGCTGPELNINHNLERAWFTCNSAGLLLSYNKIKHFILISYLSANLREQSEESEKR